MAAIATVVKTRAEIKASLSPKFNMPTARAPKMTVKLSHDRKVRSLAKKTFGSTRVGRAMRLPVGDGYQYNNQKFAIVKFSWKDTPGAV